MHELDNQLLSGQFRHTNNYAMLCINMHRKGQVCQ
jgi:hypothetical protein